MVGSLVGIRAMFAGITEDICSVGDYFRFDFGHVVGLDVVFSHGLYHRGDRSAEAAGEIKALSPHFQTVFATGSK
jgi:hypothetical protein